MNITTLNTTLRNIVVNEMNLSIDRDKNIIDELTDWLSKNKKHPDAKKVRQEIKELKSYLKGLKMAVSYVRKRLARHY